MLIVLRHLLDLVVAFREPLLINANRQDVDERASQVWLTGLMQFDFSEKSRLGKVSQALRALLSVRVYYKELRVKLNSKCSPSLGAFVRIWKVVGESFFKVTLIWLILIPIWLLI